MSHESAERWARVDDLFHRAVELGDEERRDFLSRETSGDAALAHQVLALLRAHDRPHRLLDAPSPDRLPPGMRIGPYAVERALGSGGMATVYLASRADRRFDKRVAIKLVHQGLTAELTSDRFETEQRILARLEHPHIARLLDAGITEYRQPYLVMEWVDGMPLDKWMATHPSLEARLDLWHALASAVAYAHRNLVVHRDLKPSNVIVTSDGTAKLVDFGIATLVSARTRQALTRSPQFTPLYASPEQLEGEAVTTASDVYGLGLLLFELVTGTQPFRRVSERPHEQALAALAEDLRVPASVPMDLAAILRHALRRTPEHRYATAEQFADDVQRYRRGEPVRARPETFGYRASRFIARHRVASAAAAAVTVALVTLTALALRQARIADEERARAEDVTTYLEGFLGATPTGSDWALRDRGAGLRVVELADLMAARLEESADVHPETEATLRYVLGMVYTQAGQLEPAMKHVSRAQELYARLAPPDDPRRLSADLLAAAADNMLGRFADAESIIERIQREWRNPPTSAVAGMHEQLGLAQFRLGKVDQAERTYVSALERLRQTIGEYHHNIGLLRGNLAMVHLERGRFDQAAAELERAIPIIRANARGSSISLAWALVNLANAYRFLGRNDDMLRTALEGADRMSEALGRDHFAMVHALSFVAFGKALKGEPDAESIARRAVAVQSSLAPDHYERAVGLTFLGATLTLTGKPGEAVRALDEALTLRRARFAGPNWRIAETAGFLGQALAAAGERARARDLLDESLSMFTTLYGVDNPRTVEARTRRERALH